MKRKFCIFLCAAILLGMAGCKPAQQEPNIPVVFYYPNVIDPSALEAIGEPFSVIGSEIREGEGYIQELDQILSLYLEGPVSDEMRNIFPDDLRITDINRSGDQLQITLSEHLGQLTGLDLSLACACLTMTCLELTDAQSVSIRAEGILLDGEAAVVMDRSNLLLNDADAYSTAVTEADSETK